MRKHAITILLLSFFIFTQAFSANTRVIVMSDIGGSDPDDQQSLVHLLMLLNDIDLEGFIYQNAWVPYNKGNEENIVNGILSAYEQVLPNLKVHSKGYPEASRLRQIFKQGQQQAAMKDVGEGKDSPGSEWIIKVVDSDDKRPVWIAGWAGMNTLAQALWKVRNTRTPEQLQTFTSKIRIYDILGQDDAGAWITVNFPNIVYIRNKQVYGWAPHDNWVKENVQSVGKLGRHYPNRIWATEGDSPSFLYMVNNGLNSPEHPDWGGWGGRFDLNKVRDIRSMDWVERSGINENAFGPYYMLGSSKEGVNAIRIWNDAICNNLAARLVWTVTDDYKKANHHPVVKVSKKHNLKAQPAETIKLAASKSYDPDGDTLSFKWWQYLEAGSCKQKVSFSNPEAAMTSITIPGDAQPGQTIHVICEVSDSGKPSLTSYRRFVITIR